MICFQIVKHAGCRATFKVNPYFADRSHLKCLYFQSNHLHASEAEVCLGIKLWRLWGWMSQRFVCILFSHLKPQRELSSWWADALGSGWLGFNVGQLMVHIPKNNVELNINHLHLFGPTEIFIEWQQDIFHISHVTFQFVFSFNSGSFYLVFHVAVSEAPWQEHHEHNRCFVGLNTHLIILWLHCRVVLAFLVPSSGREMG